MEKDASALSPDDFAEKYAGQPFQLELEGQTVDFGEGAFLCKENAADFISCSLTHLLFESTRLQANRLISGIE